MDDYRTFGEYRYSDKNNLPTLLSFVLIGVGVGALTALLLAPQSGKKMRRTLRRKYENARDMFDDWSDNANEYVEKGTKWASIAREKVRPMARGFGGRG